MTRRERLAAARQAACYRYWIAVRNTMPHRG